MQDSISFIDTITKCNYMQQDSLMNSLIKRWPKKE